MIKDGKMDQSLVYFGLFHFWLIKKELDWIDPLLKMDHKLLFVCRKADRPVIIF